MNNTFPASYVTEGPYWRSPPLGIPRGRGRALQAPSRALNRYVLAVDPDTNTCPLGAWHRRGYGGRSAKRRACRHWRPSQISGMWLMTTLPLSLQLPDDTSTEPSGSAVTAGYQRRW